MNKLKRLLYISSLYLMVLLLAGCKISYSFNAGALDYNIYKTISIADFPNNAELVNPTLAQTFSEELRDKYTRQTKLSILKEGGDMHLEGEIVGYQLQAMAISADSYASETKLTLTINVRFTDMKNPANDMEDKRYSASQLFDSNRMLADVEPELISIMVKEIVDKIYNDTVAKW
ncbi:MAG TPA: LptE family protein [Bacteroidales bacterium]|nr:LptE family protein [Bacteroidales bacterium]